MIWVIRSRFSQSSTAHSFCEAAANFMALAKGQALHNVVRNASAELDITLLA